MTQLSNMPVDNGDRVPVITKFYSGTAGLRSDAAGGEFACPGTPPMRLPEVTGTVDGRPVRILAIRKSIVVAGMLVVRFEYEETRA